MSSTTAMITPASPPFEAEQGVTPPLDAPMILLY
jgi:hypothetical protein